MIETPWQGIREYIDDHRNMAVYGSIFLILLFLLGFWWYLIQFGQGPVVYAGVTGSVFIDENRDGIFDEAEPGFPGILLRLIDEVGEEVTAVTDSAGIFGFTALPGPYTLTMTEESGWFSTTPITVSLTLEEDDLVFVNFGSYFEPEIDETLYGSVEGLVFRDRNLNGAFDEGEPGMSDVLIRLHDSEGVIVEEALSVEGLFSFTLVEPGQYTIKEILPEGFFNTTWPTAATSCHRSRSRVRTFRRRLWYR